MRNSSILCNGLQHFLAFNCRNAHRFLLHGIPAQKQFPSRKQLPVSSYKLNWAKSLAKKLGQPFSNHHRIHDFHASFLRHQWYPENHISIATHRLENIQNILHIDEAKKKPIKELQHTFWQNQLTPTPSLPSLLQCVASPLQLLVEGKVEVLLLRKSSWRMARPTCGSFEKLLARFSLKENREIDDLHIYHRFFKYWFCVVS